MTVSAAHEKSIFQLFIERGTAEDFLHLRDLGRLGVINLLADAARRRAHVDVLLIQLKSKIRNVLVL